MPVYCYTCEDCKKTQEEFRSIEQREDRVACEVCGEPMSRDIGAELGGVQTDWADPILSDAAGLHPDQIPEARARFSHHEFTKDGRMIFRSPKHRRRCLRDIGMVDRDGFD